VREDTNPFDPVAPVRPLALAMWWRRAKPGYIPKKSNFEVAWAISAKREVEAILTETRELLERWA
jgi:hypothetical protein